MPREPRFDGLRRFFRIPGRSLDDDVGDEIAFHVESRVRDLMAGGRSEDDARQLAARMFGDVVDARRQLVEVDRRRRRRERMRQLADAIAQDVRFAIRALRRSPGFSVTAGLTLAIGIAASVAIFAIVDGVLLRPLPYRDPGRLVGAWHDFPPLGMTHGQQSATTFFTYRTQARSIEGIAIYDENAVNVADDGSASPPKRVTSAGVSATLFPVLGVSALRGRVLTDADDQPTSPPVMLISEAMWRSILGGDPEVLGRALDVNGVRRQIVGVMPKEFRFPSAETGVWIPLGLDPVNPPANAFSYNGVARLKPGVTIADAERDFASVLPRIVELYPKFVPGISTEAMMLQVKPKPVITPFQTDVTGAIAGTLWMIAAAAGLLLLVACVNVANLTLVRADARRRESALRAALGAGPGRVASHYLCESLVVAVVAGTLAMAAARAFVRALVGAGPVGIPRLAEITVGWRVSAFGWMVVILAAAMCAAIPAIRTPRGDALREGARGSTVGRSQQRLRGVLVTAQLALGLVALTGSGLMFRSFKALHAVRPGFDAGHVEAIWISLPRVRYAGDSEVVRFFSSLTSRVAPLPGVTSVGVTSRLPLNQAGIDPNPLYPEDDPSYATKLPPLQMFTMIGDGYFNVLRIPIIAGKPFGPMVAQAESEAIVSRTAARMFWKDSTGVAAVGKRFRALPTGPLYTVVGVAEDAHDTSLAVPPSPTVYFPASHLSRTMALVVRTNGNPATVVPAVQRIVREMDPTLPTFDVRALEAGVRDSTARLAFIILILGGAAVVTLLLGAVGLYGVMAYVVTLGRRELGIRIALGASPGRMTAATTGKGMAVAAVGVVCGLVLFTIVGRFARAFLFGVAPWDPITLGGASAALLAIAAAASWIPARRAGRVDPAEALRAE